jgi:hypothetical protein
LHPPLFVRKIREAAGLEFTVDGVPQRVLVPSQGERQADRLVRGVARLSDRDLVAVEQAEAAGIVEPS